MTNFLTSELELPDADDDTTPASGRKSQAGSFNSQVMALSLGEVATRAVQADHLLLSLGRAHALVEARRRLTNSVSPAVAKLKHKTGCDYSVEIVDTFASGSGRLFLVAFVTRIA